MALIYLMFALPAVVLAGINVAIKGTIDGHKPHPEVYVSGIDKAIISDAERYTFNINDYNLKEAVNTYFDGKPADAFVHSPTPWGDLYKRYGWDQVTRTLRLKSAKILNKYVKPVVVHSQVFENNRSNEITNTFNMSWVVENTISSTWNESHAFFSGVFIGYNVDFASVGAPVSYASELGKSMYISEAVTLGTPAGMTFTLKPYEMLTVDLIASRGFVTVEIEYEVSLSGNVAVNYDPPHKDHHFWALPINEVMSSAGLPFSKTTREIIEIAVYWNGRVVAH